MMEFLPLALGLALVPCALFVVHRCKCVARESRRESDRLRDDLYQSQGETQLALRVAEGYKRLLDESRMHFARCSAVADIEHARELTAQAKAQAKAQDQHDMCLLTEVGDAVLERARADMRADAWQDYALAYEVLCEAAAEHDAVGAANASQAVANARRVLEALGQYSA